MRFLRFSTTIDPTKGGSVEFTHISRIPILERCAKNCFGTTIKTRPHKLFRRFYKNADYVIVSHNLTREEYLNCVFSDPNTDFCYDESTKQLEERKIVEATAQGCL